MSTLNDIVFSILDVVKPRNLTSSVITEELIKQYIKVVRAKLLREDLNKGHTVDSYIIQSLGCIPLVEVDKSECCLYATGCKILRTSVKIPSTIEMHSRQMFTRVGPVDRYDVSYQKIEAERVPFSGYNKYTKDLKKYFTLNNDGYLYLLVREGDLLDNSLEVISVQGIFEDPEELSKYTNCSTGQVCFSADSQYPIKEHMLPVLIELVIKKFIGVQSQSPIDNSNDNKENSESQLDK